MSLGEPDRVDCIEGAAGGIEQVGRRVERIESVLEADGQAPGWGFLRLFVGPGHQRQREVERGQVSGLEIIDGLAKGRMVAVVDDAEPLREVMERMLAVPLDVIDVREGP